MNKRRKVGKIILAAGIAALFAGIVVTFTVGTILAQILLFSSILINSAGIMLLRGKG